MKKLIVNILIAVFLLNLSGCATFEAREDGITTEEISDLYPATGIDAYILLLSSIYGIEDLFSFSNDISILKYFAFATGSIVDLPISIASDTILLPADIYCIATVKEYDKDKIIKELLDSGINFDETLSMDDSNSTNENLITMTL